MTTSRNLKLGSRIAARRSAGGSRTTPTSEDIQNIVEFSRRLDAATEILSEEVAAINEGRLDAVSDLFEKKAAALKWLEIRMPVIEPFLDHEIVATTKLQEKLTNLRQVATEDSELLERMAIAARTIVREMEKASSRNSLDGLYGKSGQKLSDAHSGQVKLNREY